MNVQPNAAIGGLAGTARAQQRGSDSETVKQQQAAVEQKQAPGQSPDADQLTLQPSGESTDRDADGRRLFESHAERNSDDSDSDPEASSQATFPPLDDDLGGELDLRG
ncbi:MAG: hypothetical protein R3C05_06600 [Pirellulaceae bacterium]